MTAVLAFVAGVAVGHFGVSNLVAWVKAKWTTDAVPPAATPPAPPAA